MVFVPVRNNLVRGWYDLVIVDEVQDLTKAQALLAMGACRKGGRIAVVGDDKQAIYQFRGADSGSLDRLKNELRATELKLTITRRCPKLVVALAKRLVPDFEAAPEAPEGKITTEPMSRLPQLVQVGDFVLSRKNAPLAGACLSILREGKRARVEGRDIGKGLIALVDKLATGKASGSMPAWLDRLAVWEAKECARWAKTKEEKVEAARDKADTLRFLADGLTGIPELKSRIADLFTDNAQAQGCVVLSSIHRAKGLEAERVFVMRDTLYPGGRHDDPEERNLEYVSITRTKNHLIWLEDRAETAPIIPAAPPAK
jgi:superfamily I DNA/RNA helicase